MSPVWFVTGTDTGVGKTVVTAVLARWFRHTGLRTHAVKPLASGGRGDARVLREALGGGVDLDAVNPWHFRAALAPFLAARAEGRRILRSEVLAFLRRARKGTQVLLIEGAGGLLSPMGQDFDARDVIRALGAVPVVVAPNRLGAINQVLLVMEALGPAAAPARVALVAPARAGVVSRSNLEVLRQRLGAGRVLEFPRFRNPDSPRIRPEFQRRLADWAGPVIS